MTNIIYLKRASARPASNLNAGSSHSRASHYEAGLSSCTMQDAAPGGSRFPRSAARASISTPEVEAHFAATVAMMFVAGCLTVALLTLVLL
jgi:hypothetical protein